MSCACGMNSALQSAPCEFRPRTRVAHLAFWSAHLSAAHVGARQEFTAGVLAANFILSKSSSAMTGMRPLAPLKETLCSSHTAKLKSSSASTYECARLTRGAH